MYVLDGVKIFSLKQATEFLDFSLIKREHLLYMLLHVLMAKVCSLSTTMAIEHSEVKDVVGHFRHLITVLVLFALADLRGEAHLGQADFGDGFAIADAGWQQNGLVDAIVPNAERVPGGGASAAIRVKAWIAGSGAWRAVQRPHHFVLIKVDTVKNHPVAHARPTT